MKRILPLTDTVIRNVKKGDPRRRLSDGKGLYLLLFVKGGAHGWRFDYTFQGVSKTLSLGTYPTITLKMAREKAEEFRRLVATGIDPSDVRKSQKADLQRARVDKARAADGLPPENSFQSVALEWYRVKKDGWSDAYASKVLRRLEVDIFPHIGLKPIQDITPAELLKVLRAIESRGVIETVHRALESCGQIFRYAIPIGLLRYDPTTGLKETLKKPVTKHMAAILEPSKLAGLLRAIDAYPGTIVVRTALQLAPMLFLRPGELRHARWCEMDLDRGIWEIPAARMKQRKQKKINGLPHLVPLPRQAVKLLRELFTYTGRNEYVFRGERDHARPMSENTINAALQRIGFCTKEEMTGHGFRATARTLLDERLGVDRAVIEMQLAHTVQDSLGTAYNRTTFGEKRIQMMQQWADYLETLKASEGLPLLKTINIQ